MFDRFARGAWSGVLAAAFELAFPTCANRSQSCSWAYGACFPYVAASVIRCAFVREKARSAQLQPQPPPPPPKPPVAPSLTARTCSSRPVDMSSALIEGWASAPRSYGATFAQHVMEAHAIEAVATRPRIRTDIRKREGFIVHYLSARIAAGVGLRPAARRLRIASCGPGTAAVQSSENAGARMCVRSERWGPWGVEVDRSRSNFREVR